MLRFAFLASALAVYSGCGATSFNCTNNGNNVMGHVVFTSTVSEIPPTGLVVEFSYNGFTTVAGHDAVSNPQGLLSIPYSLCVTTGTNFNVRAYQDLNGDTTWETGEGAGRDDSTQNGNAAFNNRNAASSSTTWNVVSGVDIYLDTSTSQ